MAITAKELARRLNLSEAAISMALNNKPGVSTETRQRVIQAARDYGYDFSRIPVPTHPLAPIYFILYKKHGAVVTDTPFFSELSEGIDGACRDARYRLNIRHLYESDDVEKQLDDIIYSGCAGIILLGTEMKPEDFKLFEQLDIPLVLLDSYYSSPKMDCVLINNMEGAYQATDYLIKTYKSQPGYLHSSYSISNFEERADGFYKAVRRNGMSPSRSVVHELSPSVDGACADMLRLLEEREEPASCYFADNDLIAAGALRAFKEKGYRIPEDIRIIGFDNMPVCTYMEPSLTTIHVPKSYIGQLAAERLIHVLQTKKHIPVKLEVATTLVKRGSA